MPSHFYKHLMDIKTYPDVSYLFGVFGFDGELLNWCDDSEIVKVGPTVCGILTLLGV